MLTSRIIRRRGSAGRWGGGLSCLAALAVGVTAVGGSVPTPDATAPRLQAEPTPAFIVGSQISTSDLRDDGPPAENLSNDQTFVKSRLSWSGSDASGICGYDVAVQPSGAAPDFLVQGTQSTTRKVDGLTDYDGALGGGALLVQDWTITAHDCAGNAATVQVFPRLLAVQDDGRVQYGGTTNTVRYKGTWGVSQCGCWSGGTLHETFTAGASSTFTTSYRRGDHVALVLATGPRRGKAAVYVDDVLVATIDTHSPLPVPRVVKWQRSLLEGIHRVKVVNLGTAGHPSIGLDAVLVD